MTMVVVKESTRLFVGAVERPSCLRLQRVFDVPVSLSDSGVLARHRIFICGNAGVQNAREMKFKFNLHKPTM